MEKKQYKGITFNECSFMGKVLGAPKFVPAGDSEYVFINLSVQQREMDANQQFADIEVVVPLLVMEASKVEVVKKYVQEGRQLKVDGYYKSWQNDGRAGHAIFVTKIQLGDRPYVPKEEQQAASAMANLPPM